MSIPVEIQPKQLPQLPATTSTLSVVCPPNNGSSFTENQQIIVDLPAGRGFLNPNSLYVRYKMTCTGMAGNAGTMIGTPVYTPFLNFQMLINNTVAENINDYNIYCEDMINLKVNVADKAGLSQALGYGNSSLTFTMNSVNGRVLSTTPDAFTLSGPLPCILSQCESYVPMFLFGATRIVITLDTLANIFNTITNVPTAYSITNFELCADYINFDPQVEAYYTSLANQAGKVVLKSSSVAVGSQPLASGASGSYQLPYSFRLASIKSLFLHSSPATATSATSNGKHDAIDITTNNGSYQFDVGGGVLYPARALSTLQNKAGIISELCLALYGNKNIASASLGITPATWNYTSSAASTAYTAPGMFIVGINTEKCPSSSSMLTGVSSLLAPVIARLEINTATSQACQVRMLAVFDALVEVDVMSREVRILQ